MSYNRSPCNCKHVFVYIDPSTADIAKQRIKCGTEKDLRDQGCMKIKNEKTAEVLGSRLQAVPDGKNVLMAPQKLEATLRLNDPFKFKINFTSPSHYPIDMYYLMDLSQSMKVNIKMHSKSVENQIFHLPFTANKVTPLSNPVKFYFLKIKPLKKDGETGQFFILDQIYSLNCLTTPIWVYLSIIA